MEQFDCKDIPFWDKLMSKKVNGAALDN